MDTIHTNELFVYQLYYRAVYISTANGVEARLRGKHRSAMHVHIPTTCGNRGYV